MLPGVDKEQTHFADSQTKHPQLMVRVFCFGADNADEDQETFARLRQRMKAAPPVSNAAAAHVPGSGTAAVGS